MSPDKEMTFMEHLEELRKRILYCLYSLIPATVLSFTFARPLLEMITYHARVMDIPIENAGFPFKFGISPVVGPILLYQPPSSHTILQSLSPTETVVAYMKIAIVAAIFIVFPAIMHQVWKFVEPGLKPTEKKFLLPFIVSSWISFILGGLFAYFAMLKFAVPFLASFGEGITVSAWSLSSYVTFVLQMLLIFGIVFEIPVIVGLLSMLGLITPAFLIRYRRHSILVIFIVAAVLTPPDPLTIFLLAIPMVLLFELSILICKLTQRKPETALIKP